MVARTIALPLAALLLCAPCARAALVASAEAGGSQTAGSFSARILSSTEDPSEPEALFSVLRRSPFSSNHAPFTPKNNVQASLWLFVSSAQAVRSGDGFQVLQSSLVTASGNSGALLSAVPLPGSGWLFGIGLLGAGVALRLAWRRDSSSPANALPMGA